jgi:hypothetical protein
VTFIHITIVWRGSEKGLDQLRPILDLAEDWVTYGGSNWIIYTSENISTWNGRMQAVINTAVDSVVLCEIPNKDAFAGWVPIGVVEWIHKPRFSGSLLPPPRA